MQTIKKKERFKTCYRIVKDSYLGYEVQYKKWWFPFWIQSPHLGSINSFKEINNAIEWINNGCPKYNKVVWEKCN